MVGAKLTKQTLKALSLGLKDMGMGLRSPLQEQSILVFYIDQHHVLLLVVVCFSVILFGSTSLCPEPWTKNVELRRVPVSLLRVKCPLEPT